MTFSSLSHLSQRLAEVAPSPTIGLSAKIAELKAQGREILPLNVGEADFPPPKEVLQATQQALTSHQTRYSLVLGIPELREAIQEKLREDNQLSVETEGILLTNGSKQALYTIFQTLLNPGDEVIIPIPYWVSFPESVKLAGGVPRFVSTQNDYQLDLEKLENAITKKTKILLINTPNNPSGAVYPKKDLQELAELALKHNLYVVSDEAYEQLTFDDNEHVSIASLSQEIFERTLTVQSFSKSFAMTGFRLGYVAGSTSLINELAKLQGHLSGNSCTFAQYGALAALREGKDFLLETRKLFEKRRDQTYDQLQDLFPSPKPQGAFYFFPNVEHLYSEKIQSCEDLSQYLLEKIGVALVPGRAFGAPGYMRLSFATSDDNLTKALEKLRGELS